MITKDIARHEFIGLTASTQQSRNKSLAGLEGKVIDETKNSFVLLTKDRERKTVLKKGSTFIFHLPDGSKVRIRGEILAMKPEDRIKMKIR